MSGTIGFAAAADEDHGRVFVVQLRSRPRGPFGALFLTALRRNGLLPVASAPVTPAVWVDVRPLPLMRTYPISDRAWLDVRT